jgi:DNA-binding transcriptional ArsR family regulator
VTFGAVSQHLGVLRRAGLVSVRKDGTRRFYRADREALGPLAGWLEQMWAGELDRLAALAEELEDDLGAKRQYGKRPPRRVAGRTEQEGTVS